MNSAIRTCQSPLPVAPGRLSSASRVHISLSHGSLSVSLSSKGSHLVSRPSYVKCTVEVERFSEGSRMKEENGKNNIVRGAGRASLVLACVLGAFTLSGKMNTKPNLAYAASTQHRSQGPVLSLTSNFNTEEPERSDIENLKLFAMSLSQNGRKDAAESIMRCECNKWKGTSSSNQLKVALIELLLYQGKYQEAKKPFRT
ncbi:uncharacterized protein LOC129305213 [Prosopis cineraria]|uniref:uncharacterized protein LOC129305213 n=1 Tax=Prosopis cineraria TaxID=364024 RepID=UPI0024108A1F|nr:uncharacterized protein LOC129305213 [Prosopis cineraria]